MTTPKNDNVSKSSYTIGLTIISIMLASICGLLLIVFNSAQCATIKNTEIEIKLEKHISTYESVRESLTDIKTFQKEQCSKLEEQGKVLYAQGQKLDELNKKITNHCTTIGNINP